MTNAKKPPPNLAAAVEKDLTMDLRKVGGFFKGLWNATQKAERMIQVAAEPTHPESQSPPRAIGRGKPDVVVEASACDVCGGTRLVGGAKKIPCPACK
jgi:hypothetical protein